MVSKKNVSSISKGWLIAFVLCYLAVGLFAANGDYERDSFRRGGCHRGPLRFDGLCSFRPGHCCPGWGCRELITGTGGLRSQRREGLDAFAAISKAAVVRPIILTSVTTFVGLIP